MYDFYVGAIFGAICWELSEFIADYIVKIIKRSR